MFHEWVLLFDFTERHHLIANYDTAWHLVKEIFTHTLFTKLNDVNNLIRQCDGANFQQKKSANFKTNLSPWPKMKETRWSQTNIFFMPHTRRTASSLDSMIILQVSMKLKWSPFTFLKGIVSLEKAILWIIFFNLKTSWICFLQTAFCFTRR